MVCKQNFKPPTAKQWISLGQTNIQIFYFTWKRIDVSTAHQNPLKILQVERTVEKLNFNLTIGICTYSHKHLNQSKKIAIFLEALILI